MRLAERLAGVHLLLTGATGFVGEALLERVLSDLPDTRVTLAGPRPHRRAGAGPRARAAAQAAFAPLRARDGDEAVDALLGTRLEVVEGDLGAALAPLPGDLDVVLHCAGEVSFDPPVDEGFRTNLLGTLGLLEALRATGAQPHVVHVSTAYVAGLRSGWVPEARHPHTVDWRAEAAAAARCWGARRRRQPRAGRAPRAARRGPRHPRRRRARRRSRSRPSGCAAGGSASSSSRPAGSARSAWAGPTATRSPRRWPSARSRRCAPTGACRCRSCARASSRARSSRPSPGWIEGFKMAEPLILAYGQGMLPDFPAAPDAAIDIVPVDVVVGALVAAAATPPPRRASRSGTRSARAPATRCASRRCASTSALLPAHPLPQRGRGHARRARSGTSRARRGSSAGCAFAERAHRRPAGRCACCPPPACVRRADAARRPRAPAARRAPAVRPLPRLHAGRAGLRRPQHPGAARGDGPGRPGAVRLRRRRRRLGALPGRPALPGGHRPAALGGALPPRPRRPAARPSPTPPAAPSPPSTWTARCCRRPSSRRWSGCGSPTRRAAGGRASSRACVADLPRLLAAERHAAGDRRAGRHRALRGRRRRGARGARRRAGRRRGAVAARARRGAGRARAPRRRAPHRARHRRARGVHPAARAAVRRGRGRPAGGRGPTAGPPAGWSSRRSSARPARRGWRAARPTRAGTSAAPPRTPTACPTCRCCAPSGSRSRSTRTPRWPASPAGRSGRSCTGRRPRAAPASRWPGRCREGAVMRALEVYRSLPRYLATRAAHGPAARAAAAGLAPLRLAERPAPRLPGAGWVRVRPPAVRHLRQRPRDRRRHAPRSTSRRWCRGPSRPATRSSASCSTTRPACPPAPASCSTRCCPAAARGLDDCSACASGATNRCARVTLGHVAPGLQTGYCRDTGGGWSGELVAHVASCTRCRTRCPTSAPCSPSRWPARCTSPGARSSSRAPRCSSSAPARSACSSCTRCARSPRPGGSPSSPSTRGRRSSPASSAPTRWWRRRPRSRGAPLDLRRAPAPERGSDLLLGGVDVAVECAGSRVRPRPGAARHPRRRPRGARRHAGARRPRARVVPRARAGRARTPAPATTSHVALDLLADPRLAGLRTSWHPLSRYREALDEAGDAGRLGLAKVGFDLAGTEGAQ